MRSPHLRHLLLKEGHGVSSHTLSSVQDRFLTQAGTAATEEFEVLMDAPSLGFRLFICKVRGLDVLPGPSQLCHMGICLRPWLTGAKMALQAIPGREHVRRRWDTYTVMYHEVRSELEALASRMDLSHQTLFAVTRGLAFLYCVNGRYVNHSNVSYKSIFSATCCPHTSHSCSSLNTKF